MSIYLGSDIISGNGRHTVSNAHDLLDFKFADHVINNLSWLDANTYSWQSGQVYSAVYEHLVTDYGNGTEESETLSGVTITYRLCPDGHKIALPDQEINIQTLYTYTGQAWYFILDETNVQFKLPRVTHRDLIEKWEQGFNWYRVYSDGWCEQGGTFTSDVDGWQNATVILHKPFRDTYYHANITSSWGGNGDGASYYYANNNKKTTQFSANVTHRSSVYGHATWSACGYTSINKPVALYNHLYFYVGEYIQSAIEQTAGITSEQLNNKVDVGHQVIESKFATASDPTWYRLYADGWVEQGGWTENISYRGYVTLPKQMYDTYYTIQMIPSAGGPTTTYTGDNNWLAYTWTGKETGRFQINLIDSDGTSATDNRPFYWEVKGRAANT